MGKRSNNEDNTGVKKGPWLPEEDTKLVAYINKNGHGSWSSLPQLAGLNRCGKSCRLRWTNYLRPDIKRGMFSDHEERTIIHLHSLLGNKWSAIASHLPGRTDNEIKNFWNTRLRKKLLRMGIDPVTHKPRADHILFSNLPQCFSNGNQIEKFQLLRDIIMGVVTTNNKSFSFAQVMGGGGDATPQLGFGSGCDGFPFVLPEVEEEGYGSFLGGGQAPMVVDDGDNGGVCFSGMGSGEASLNCSSDSEIFDAWREFKEDGFYDQGCCSSWGEIIN